MNLIFLMNMDEVIQNSKKDSLEDSLIILNGVNELPFSFGKKLLVDFLYGDLKNPSIKKNKLEELKHFGILKLEKEEILKKIDNLIDKELLTFTSLENNRFLKVLKVSFKGNKELTNPKKETKYHNFLSEKTVISENDRILFIELDSFLHEFNDEQKKAIISNRKKILCIAGAGSGKTTCLTKRIEFLVKYRGVNSKKILAVTFTRKAREEMQNRLGVLNIETSVETFNSFSEKILRKNTFAIYGRPMNILGYGNKIVAISSALNSIGLTMDEALDKYYPDKERKNKTKEELSNLFMNDCFFILDYFKSKRKELYDFSIDADTEDKNTAKMIHNICKHIREFMRMQSLRNYTDQILDAIDFFKKDGTEVPDYEHILVDEYQDVNAMQVELLDTLNAPNLFCVGDPRQSIYGWRGSDMKFILEFDKKHLEFETIHLIKNYRSKKTIVNLINKAIIDMKLPDLIANNSELADITLNPFSNECEELEFIIDSVSKSTTPREDIFILARTNRQLKELSKNFRQKNISHVIKTDDSINNNSFIQKKGEIMLATIHSIKGLEARLVYVIGCNEQNFPCRASDHPIIEIVKVEEYDKYEEEKRLFYVALSRARDGLILTYTGKKPTSFLTKEMLEMIEKKGFRIPLKKEFHRSQSIKNDGKSDEERDWGDEKIAWKKKEESNYQHKENWDDMISDND